MQHKAIFLDRDGVLNEAIIKDGKPYSPYTLSEFVIVEDAASALHQLKLLNYLLIVVTNQPDVARGYVAQTTIEQMHAHLKTQLPIDDIRVCYHDDHDACACRKPKPGMLYDAAHDHHIRLENSILIGDRWKDIAAGQQAGCKTIWLNKNYHAIQQPTSPHFITTHLAQAVDWIKSQNNLF